MSSFLTGEKIVSVTTGAVEDFEEAVFVGQATGPAQPRQVSVAVAMPFVDGIRSADFTADVFAVGSGRLEFGRTPFHKTGIVLLAVAAMGRPTRATRVVALFHGNTIRPNKTPTRNAKTKQATMLPATSAPSI